MTRRCDCERGGDCNKVSLCALTNAEDEHAAQIERIRENLELARAHLRNDQYKTRVKNALAIIEEALIEAEGE